jgi:hypothetical protein
MIQGARLMWRLRFVVFETEKVSRLDLKPMTNLSKCRHVRNLSSFNSHKSGGAYPNLACDFAQFP